MGMSCSNSSFIGYPILLLTLAPVAGVALAMNVLVENVVMLPLIITLAENGRGDGRQSWRRVLRLTLARLARNPLVIALAAGLTVSLLEWPLPAPLGRTVTLFAQASGALSLFVIGGTLVGLPMHGLARQVAPIMAGKLLLHPLAVALAMAGLAQIGAAPADPQLRHAAIMNAAMPMMSIYPIVAQAYGLENRSAAALVLTTSASFVTLSVLLWLG
jgi:predicted permease